MQVCPTCEGESVFDEVAERISHDETMELIGTDEFEPMDLVGRPAIEPETCPTCGGAGIIDDEVLGEMSP